MGKTKMSLLAKQSMDAEVGLEQVRKLGPQENEALRETAEWILDHKDQIKRPAYKNRPPDNW